MRPVVTILLLIFATILGAYALAMSQAVPPEPTVLAYQAIGKIVMLHASFAVIGAEAYVILARPWLRIAAAIPTVLGGVAYWEVYKIWPLAFPG